MSETVLVGRVCVVAPGEPGRATRMWVWRFHLNAELLSLVAVGVWGGILLHCGGCSVRGQLHPSTPCCDNQRSLQALPNATWWVKSPQNKNHGLKVNKEAPCTFFVQEHLRGTKETLLAVLGPWRR